MNSGLGTALKQQVEEGQTANSSIPAPQHFPANVKLLSEIRVLRWVMLLGIAILAVLVSQSMDSRLTALVIAAFVILALVNEFFRR